MGDLLITAKSGKPGSSEIVLISGDTSTGYNIHDWDLGNVAWELIWSGMRGTQGAQLAGAVPKNRPLVIDLRVTGMGAMPADDLQAKLSVVSTLADELRRFGGRVTVRLKGGSFRFHFDVFAGTAAIEDYDWAFLNKHTVIQRLEAICAPYLKGDPMDVADDFSSDRLGEYAFDMGAASDLAVSSGELDAVANLATEKRAIYSYYGYPLPGGFVWTPQHTAAKLDDFKIEPFTYRNISHPEEIRLRAGDKQVTVKVTPGATITDFKAGVVFAWVDALNYLVVYVDDNGTNSRLRLDKVVVGATTNLATLNLSTRIAAGTSFWVRGRIEGYTVTREYFTSEPTPMGAATHSGATDLSAAEQTTFELDAHDPIPGDARALADLLVTASGATTIPQWAVFGWVPRPLLWSYVWNGDFESDDNGWSDAAVTNITAGCTSTTRVATAAKFGAASLEVVCPSTADAGTSFRIYRRVKRGVTYTAEAWVRSAAGTTLAYLRLGNGPGNDKASSTPVALSTTWTKHTFTWTPSADREVVDVAVNIGAATATTFQIDGVSVYEGTTAPSLWTQIEGRGAAPPVGVLEAESCDTGDLTTLAVASDSSSRLGFGLSASSPSGSAAWFVDPSLLIGDDFGRGEVSIEVWARIEIPTTATSLVATLRADPGASASLFSSRYTEEFGASGRSLPLPSVTAFGLYRLGTLRFWADRDGPARWKLSLTLSGAGTGTVIVDALALYLTSARALSPTGKASGFPQFVKTVAQTTRLIRSDLTGAAATPPNPLHPEHGLGGSLLEFPPGALDVLLRLSAHIPDTSIASSITSDDEVSQPATVSVFPTPRFHLARPD